MVTPGHERWHPNPDFYYLPGGGPLLDMGPYYVTALVTLLGAGRLGDRRRQPDPGHPHHRLAARAPARRSRSHVDTHVTGVLTHASGVLSTLVMSFDAVRHSRRRRSRCTASSARWSCPTPTGSTATCELRALAAADWRTLPVSAGYRDAGRGYRAGRPGRHPGRVASRGPAVELAFHVLEVMESLLASARSGQRVDIESRVERPPVVPLGDGPFVG